MLTHKLDHVTEAVANLLQQFRGKVKLEAFVAILAKQIQAIEDALFQILLDTDLLSVVGIQLDGLGKLLNQPRNGQDDDTYRLFLRAKILVIMSRGTVDEILAILVLLVGSSPTIVMIDAPDTDPATFEIDITSDLPVDVNPVVISTLALQAKSPGIRGMISFRHTPSFRFDTAGRGFDQGNKFSATVEV